MARLIMSLDFKFSNLSEKALLNRTPVKKSLLTVRADLTAAPVFALRRAEIEGAWYS